ncbi:MAG: hypothetical protein ACI9VR_001750 [Cognaticolwellia sp.]|jgi:hypothetical protein
MIWALLACTPTQAPLASFEDARVGDRIAWTYTRHREDFRQGWKELQVLDSTLLLELEVVALEPERVWLRLRASDADGVRPKHPALAQDLLIPVERIPGSERSLGPKDGRIDAPGGTFRYTTERQDGRPQGGWLRTEGWTRSEGPLYLSDGLLLLERTSGSENKVLDAQRLEIQGVAPGLSGDGELPDGLHLLVPGSWHVEGRWTQNGLVATRSEQTLRGATLIQTRATYRPADKGAASSADCLQVDIDVVCRDALPQSVTQTLLPEVLMNLATRSTNAAPEDGLLTQHPTQSGPVQVRVLTLPDSSFLDGQEIAGDQSLAYATQPEALEGLYFPRALDPLEETHRFPQPARALDTRAALWAWSEKEH